LLLDEHLGLVKLVVPLLHLAVVLLLGCLKAADLKFKACDLCGDLLLAFNLVANVLSHCMHNRCDSVLSILGKRLCSLALFLLLLVTLPEDELDQLVLAHT